MKVLIFGASGPVGGVVTRMALERGYSGRLFVRDAAKAKGDGLDQAGVEIVEGNLDRLATAIEAGEGCDAIISCVPLAFVKPVLRVAKWNRIRRVVLFSSTRLFSKAPCPSVSMVRDGEDIIRRSGYDWTLLRPTMVVDYPRDQNVSKLARLMEKFPVLPVPGSGKQLVQPVHVSDCARATLDSLEKKESIGKALTLAGGEVLTYRGMLETIAERLSKKRRFISVPLRPFLMVHQLLPFVFNRIGIERAMIERMGEDKAFSIEETRRILDWDPMNFEEMMNHET